MHQDDSARSRLDCAQQVDKMDIANIPRLGTVVLTGLDFSMKPEHARYEADNSFIKPFPEIKIMHQIKSLAVMVYNQEKLTPYVSKNRFCLTSMI